MMNSNLVLQHTAVVLLATALTLTSAFADSSLPIPEIRFNQLGFQPNSPKRAIFKSDARRPIEWRLVAESGAIEARGQTQVFGENVASGEHVHSIDFSDFQTPGPAYRLVVGGIESRSFPIAADVLDELKYDALAYFYHNRSGIPIDAKYVKDAQWARPAGHLPERVGCISGPDGQGNDWPGCDYQLDATGGWYDAGDHGKYVVNAGISVWTLLNYYERTQATPAAGAFADGKLSIPERDNNVNDLLDEVRWELKFLLGMQAPQGAKMFIPKLTEVSGKPLEFEQIDVSGMVHHKLHGKEWTPIPSAPHEDTEPRFAYPPSTTATLNLAANAAQCARIWRSIDAEFAKRCLEAGTRAYEAAVRNPDWLPRWRFSGGGGYGDRDASDEFYWAASELFITTGEQKYANAMRSSPHFLSAPQADGSGEIAWPQVRALGTISLIVVPNALAEKDLTQARENLLAAADRYLQQMKREGYAIPYSAPQYQWGSNSAILNHALVLGVAYDLSDDSKYRNGVVHALDYILGRNPLDQSYVSGYGARPLQNPHHRHWSRQLDAAYPPPPPGALSGGPNSSNMSDPIAKQMQGSCLPQTCWKDDVGAYALNEVAINWNAPLFWVAAFLTEGDRG